MIYEGTTVAFGLNVAAIVFAELIALGVVFAIGCRNGFQLRGYTNTVTGARVESIAVWLGITQALPLIPTLVLAAHYPAGLPIFVTVLVTAATIVVWRRIARRDREHRDRPQPRPQVQPTPPMPGQPLPQQVQPPAQIGWHLPADVPPHALHPEETHR